MPADGFFNLLQKVKESVGEKRSIDRANDIVDISNEAKCVHEKQDDIKGGTTREDCSSN